MLYCKSEPQSDVDSTQTHKLYYSRSIITDRTAHNKNPDTVMLDKTTKESYLTDVALSNSYNLRSTISERLQKYTHLKEELVTTLKLTADCITTLLLTLGYYKPRRIYWFFFFKFSDNSHLGTGFSSWFPCV
jgi:hypothetical protein